MAAPDGGLDDVSVSTCPLGVTVAEAMGPVPDRLDAVDCLGVADPPEAWMAQQAWSPTSRDIIGRPVRQGLHAAAGPDTVGARDLPASVMKRVPDTGDCIGLGEELKLEVLSKSVETKVKR
jgi:hypothetical protein